MSSDPSWVEAPSSPQLPETDATIALRYLISPELAPLFRQCERVDRESGWFGHLPFAHWLIRAARPETLVELGTHAGISYAAFCQAIEAEKLVTRCYAVDTWQGDPQAGHYDESVYQDLRCYHNGRFAAFSQMLRCTFDEALERFADGSIDLLHIDGLHTYDAVRHDFESWLPKLSERAVVLFHDTNERQSDFGVWKLWSELSGRWPSFEFLHGHGLGVLCVGVAAPGPVIDLCALPEAEAAAIRARFANLGERWDQESQARTVRHALEAASSPAVKEQLTRVPELEAALRAAAEDGEHATQQIASLTAALDQALAGEQAARDALQVVAERERAAIAEIERSTAAAAEAERTAAITLERERQLLRRECDALRSTLSRTQLARQSEREDYGHESSSWAAERNAWAVERSAWAVERSFWALQQEMANHTEHRAAKAEYLLAATRSSSSWRLTAPLRSLAISLRLQAERLRLLARAAAPRGDKARRVIAASVHRRMGRTATPAALAILNSDVQLIQAPAEVAPLAITSDYTLWRRRFDTPGATDLEHLIATASRVPAAVVVLVVTPDSLAFAERTIVALRACIGINLKVLPLFPGCPPAEARRFEILLHESGILIETPGGIGEDEPLIFLESGALPRAHGPRLLVDALSARPKTVLAYSDEDSLGADGIPSDPFFKPRFSPRLAEAGLLLGRMVALRGEGASMLRRHLSGGGEGDPSTIARDAALTAGEDGVAHVPHVLFTNALPRPAPHPVQRLLPERLPLVSIFIPTRNGWSLLGPCLESLTTTDWPADRLEIIVIDNGSTEAATMDGMDAAEGTGQIRVIRDTRPFNYSRLNNTAARVAKGEFFVLLNNDTIVREPGWLRTLIAEAAAPGVGAVGAKLLYPDDTVQHGGVVLGVQGGCGHAHHGLQAQDGGYMGLANLNHEIAANTGACLAVRRDVYFAVGGLDERFRVAFNDVIFCLDLHAMGLRNIYVGRPLITHYESKTRGFDDTPEKIRLIRSETVLSWELHAALLRDDPFYSPNLSLEVPYTLAFAPRRRPAWRPPAGRALRIMMLSSTHARGHGVAVVIEQQVRALVAAGHEVILAGYRSDRDFDYGGREVIEVYDPRIAAALAVEQVVDVIVAHTPPFFSVARWTGSYPPLIAYDYGEPPPDLFPDAAERWEVMAGKRLAFMAATRILAISDAVAAEAEVAPDAVAPLANSHLGRWSPAFQDRRAATRAARGWNDSFVVLNVCRFHAGERLHKGVDIYADLSQALMRVDPLIADRTVLVLCGKGNSEDIRDMQARGLFVAADVSDEEMADLYAAADAYANFSLWEGYNLGIGQAMAMGLPVVASDIPAHRAFGVEVAQNAQEAAQVLAEFAASDAPREARIREWADVLPAFIFEIEGVARGELERSVRTPPWADLVSDATSSSYDS